MADIIKESGLTGKDFADASMLIMRSIHSKGHDRDPKEDAAEWEKMFRFSKAGAMLGDAKCISHLADIYYGQKTEEAKACQNHFEEAVRLWKEAAEKGNGQSATNLGLLYLNKPIPGAGSHGTLEYNEEKALEYFKLGHELGDMKAGRHVGLCYKEGKGVPQDDKLAFEWFGKAAERGDSSARLYMADCILKGEGTEQNVDDAIERYKALVECKGHDVTNAAFALANIYREGKYVASDLEKSKEYYNSVIRTASPIETNLKEAAQKALEELGA